VKKLLLVVALAGVGYLVYRQIQTSKAEDDLWTEATSAPDLT
jgi:threonine/homoserine/homoserine lactone efflux protein